MQKLFIYRYINFHTKIFDSADIVELGFIYGAKSTRLKPQQFFYCLFKYTGAPIVGIARWSVPRIGQGHLEVKW